MWKPYPMSFPDKEASEVAKTMAKFFLYSLVYLTLFGSAVLGLIALGKGFAYLCGIL